MHQSLERSLLSHILELSQKDGLQCSRVVLQPSMVFRRHRSNAHRISHATRERSQKILPLQRPTLFRRICPYLPATAVLSLLSSGSRPRAPYALLLGGQSSTSLLQISLGRPPHRKSTTSQPRWIFLIGLDGQWLKWATVWGLPCMSSLAYSQHCKFDYTLKLV